MKDFLIKYLLLLIIGSATIIFCLAAIMQNIFNMELKDSLSLIIAFIGIFTTFGGAYLGAKISGENALHNIKRQNYIDKVDKLKAIQSEITFNMNYLWNFLSKVYQPLGFSRKSVKIKLESVDRETEYFYLNVYNKLVKNDLTQIKIDKSFYLNLLLLKDIINSNSREYRLFDEIFPDNEKKYFNIDKFYKLKQNIDIVMKFITMKESYVYIHLNLESKQYIISLFDFADQVNDILLKSPPTTDKV